MHPEAERLGRLPPAAPALDDEEKKLAAQPAITAPALTSASEGVATWPETATAVAVRLHRDGELEVTAPYGLRDLLTGVCRRNPERVSVERYRERIQAKHVATRWPRVRIVW